MRRNLLLASGIATLFAFGGTAIAAAPTKGTSSTTKTAPKAGAPAKRKPGEKSGASTGSTQGGTTAGKGSMAPSGGATKK